MNASKHSRSTREGVTIGGRRIRHGQYAVVVRDLFDGGEPIRVCGEPHNQYEDGLAALSQRVTRDIEGLERRGLTFDLVRAVDGVIEYPNWRFVQAAG